MILEVHGEEMNETTLDFAAVVCSCVDEIPPWVDAKTRQLIAHDMSDPFQCGSVCIIKRGGEIVLFWEDHNAPEDNTYSRKFSWVVDELTRAYEMGRSAR